MKSTYEIAGLGFPLRRSVCAAAVMLVTAVTAMGQVSADPARFSPLAAGYMERARVMLDAGNYAGAIDQLGHIETHDIRLSDREKEEYTYILAQALYQRGDAECVRMLKDFCDRFPASPYALDARLSIADYYFFAHRWPEALTAYGDIDFARLNATRLPEYTYRKALSMVKTGYFAESVPLFAKIRSNPEYRNASMYYLAYVDYVKGEYDKAYQGFAKVSPADGIEPGYYMTQIEYIRGEYDNVINHGRSLLQKRMVPAMAGEVSRIVGLSYFKRDNYAVARQFLENYMDTAEGGTPDTDAVYALGVCDYNDGDYRRAAERFSTLTELETDIGQSAWLYLGQCDIRDGNPDTAAMAFEKAAKMGCDREVTETALYNYAAAVTRGGKIPFASSATLLEQFIKSYPDSEYTPRIEEYLAQAYYNDRDYDKALKYIEAIRRPSKDVLSVKQKILYQLGVNAVTSGQNAEAVKYLKRSLELSSYDAAPVGDTWLWLGDALYAAANFKEAESAYRKASELLQASANRSLALYDYAYATYMQGNYREAARRFATAVAAKPALPAPLADDALIRRADCLYYNGDWSGARSVYDEAVRRGASDSDYAGYRHAVMVGLGGDISGKIREISDLQKKYPSSQWLPAALMEKALSYESLGQTANALKTYDELARQYPDARQARKALLNLAVTAAKAHKDKESVDAYKEVIMRWPSSEEASLANDDLRRYYAAKGELGEYAAFLRTVPEARQLDAGEMEQLAFDSAETAFADNINDIRLLRNYVNDFPDGKYLAAALLDIAMSLRNSGKYQEAEETLTRLTASRPHSAQYAEALLMKAEILEDNIPGRKRDALTAYKELERSGGPDFAAEAYAGVMRTTDDAAERAAYARKTRQSGGLSPDRIEEAKLYEAKSLLETGDADTAVTLLSELSGNHAGKAGAEAAVTLAQYWLDHKKYDKAESVALAFTDAGTPHQYWLAKGFIALADAYRGQGKTYLAKEYLQSLRDNYPGKEKEIASAISSRLKSWK